MYVVLVIFLVALYFIALKKTRGRQPPLLADGYWPIIGHALMFIKNPAGTIWKEHRKLLNPTFNQEVLDSYMSEFNAQARLLVNKLDNKAGTGRFDPAPYLDHATLQTICSTAMGVISDEKEKEMREHYLRAKNNFSLGLIKRAQTFWLHNNFIYNLTNLGTMQANHARTLHALTNAVIDKRKSDMNNKRVNSEQRFKPFLDLLLSMERDGTLTTKEVKEEVDTFTFTGSDTVSVSFELALLNIGSYPDVQRKVFEELKEVFHGSDRDVEKEDMVHLKYLEAVIRESLRLYPAIPLVARTLDKHLETRLNYAIMLLKLTLTHLLRRYHVFADIAELEQTMNVVAQALPKDYISIERREEIDSRPKLQ